jgi:hypothetical protein
MSRLAGTGRRPDARTGADVHNESCARNLPAVEEDRSRTGTAELITSSPIATLEGAPDDRLRHLGAGAAQTVHATPVAAPAVLSQHPAYLLGELRVGKRLSGVGKAALLVLPGRVG